MKNEFLHKTPSLCIGSLTVNFFQIQCEYEPSEKGKKEEEEEESVNKTQMRDFGYRTPKFVMTCTAMTE